jgi:pimeloyl-ACP methyl ester carboxylesterase
MSVQTSTIRVSHEDLSESTRLVELPGGLRLPYVAQGEPDGTPVVLLHGLSDSWRSYELLLPEFPESIYAVALSLRGHGDADRPMHGYAVHDFADDLATFLDVLDLDKAIVVGHSMGSVIAAKFASAYPDRTLGLVLMAGFYRSQENPVLVDFWESVLSKLEDPVDRAFARGFQEETTARPIASEQMDVFVTESLKVPARVWRGAAAGIMADEHVEQMGAITAPTLILWGDRDTFTPESDQIALRQAIPGARLQIYRGIGHALHWEVPARVAQDIVAFAAEIQE